MHNDALVISLCMHFIFCRGRKLELTDESSDFKRKEARGKSEKSEKHSNNQIIKVYLLSVFQHGSSNPVRDSS